MITVYNNSGTNQSVVVPVPAPGGQVQQAVVTVKDGDCVSFPALYNPWDTNILYRPMGANATWCWSQSGALCLVNPDRDEWDYFTYGIEAGIFCVALMMGLKVARAGLTLRDVWR